MTSEPLTIIIDTLDHGPCDLGSMDPTDPIVIATKAKVALITEKYFARMFDDMFSVPFFKNQKSLNPLRTGCVAGVDINAT